MMLELVSNVITTKNTNSLIKNTTLPSVAYASGNKGGQKVTSRISIGGFRSISSLSLFDLCLQCAFLVRARRNTSCLSRTLLQQVV